MSCQICGSQAKEHMSMAASQMGHGNALDADFYLNRAQLHQTLADTHGPEAHSIDRNGGKAVYKDHRGNFF